MWSYRNVFKYPLTGSITNGKYLFLKKFGEKLMIGISENRYGMEMGKPMYLKPEQIDFIVGSGNELFFTPPNIPFVKKMEDSELILTRHGREINSDDVRITIKNGDYEQHMDFETNDFFRKLHISLSKVKKLMNVHKDSKSLKNEIIEAITLIAFERLRNRMICPVCAGSVGEHIC